MTLENGGVARRGKRLVLTASDQLGSPMLDVTGDLMLSYASRMGADFKALRHENHTDAELIRPHAIKFHTAYELEFYERVLWIDADCLVSPAAPDLFELVPQHFGLAAWSDELRVFEGHPVRRPTHYAHGYFNGGVMLCGDANLFRLAMDYMQDPQGTMSQEEVVAIMADQTPLNKAVHELGVSVFPLSESWNFLVSEDTCRRLGYTSSLETAHIVHCAGGMHLAMKNKRDRSERAAGMSDLRRRLGW